MQLVGKVNFLTHFDYFSWQGWCFGIICLNLQKLHLKIKSLTILNGSLPVKSTQKFAGWTSQISICKKLSPVVHFDYSSMIAWLFDITYQILKRFIENSSLKTFKNISCSKQTLGDPLDKEWDEDVSVLSFATKYLCQATYHPNVEAISFVIR